MKCDMQEGSEGAEVRQLQKYLHLLKVEDAASSSYGNWVSKAESRNQMSRFTPPVEVGVSVIHCCVMNLVTFFFFFPGCTACGILVPQPGIEPVPPALEARSLNHWTAREVPKLSDLVRTTSYYCLPQFWDVTGSADGFCWGLLIRLLSDGT